LGELATKADLLGLEQATKADLHQMEERFDHRLKSELMLLEQRMTIKLGVLMVLAVTVVATLVKLL
jgi:hypothetical protein